VVDGCQCVLGSLRGTTDPKSFIEDVTLHRNGSRKRCQRGVFDHSRDLSLAGEQKMESVKNESGNGTRVPRPMQWDRGHDYVKAWPISAPTSFMFGIQCELLVEFRPLVRTHFSSWLDPEDSGRLMEYLCVPCRVLNLFGFHRVLMFHVTDSFFSSWRWSSPTIISR